MELDQRRYEQALVEARLRLAVFEESKHPRVHGRFAKVAKELSAISKAATDRYASEHGVANDAAKLARATASTGNPRYDVPGQAKQLSRNLRSITWGPNAKKLTALAGEVDKARTEDYDHHIGNLRSEMGANGTHYTPETLASARDIGDAQRRAADAGSKHVTVKIPSGSEMTMTHRQAHHLKHGRPS